jgi:TPR repeat protein
MALKWYLKAAETGNCLAQFQCGYIYRNGEGGIPKNDHEGYKWYSLAAEQGDAKAQLQLGCCYLTGAGVKQDIGKAIEWLKKSERQGEASATELLQMIPRNKDRPDYV